MTALLSCASRENPRQSNGFHNFRHFCFDLGLIIGDSSLLRLNLGGEGDQRLIIFRGWSLSRAGCDQRGQADKNGDGDSSLHLKMASVLFKQVVFRRGRLPPYELRQ